MEVVLVDSCNTSNQRSRSTLSSSTFLLQKSHECGMSNRTWGCGSSTIDSFRRDFKKILGGNFHRSTASSSSRVLNKEQKNIPENEIRKLLTQETKEKRSMMVFQN